MKRVLWVSRHQMSPSQLTDLERVLAAPVELLPWPETVTSAADLLPALVRCDVLAVVLPLALVAELLPLADGRPVLQSVAERLPTGRYTQLPDGSREAEFCFTHCYWQQILSLKLETRRL